MALATSMTGSPYSIYKVFANAELPYPKVKLSTGEEVTLNQAGYSNTGFCQTERSRIGFSKHSWSGMKSSNRPWRSNCLPTLIPIY